jgi:hypothetical protein
MDVEATGTGTGAMGAGHARIITGAISTIPLPVISTRALISPMCRASRWSDRLIVSGIWSVGYPREREGECRPAWPGPHLDGTSVGLRDTADDGEP